MKSVEYKTLWTIEVPEKPFVLLLTVVVAPVGSVTRQVKV